MFQTLGELSIQDRSAAVDNFYNNQCTYYNLGEYDNTKGWLQTAIELS